MKRISILATPVLAASVLAACGSAPVDQDKALHDAFVQSRESAQQYWDALDISCMSYYRNTYGNVGHYIQKWEDSPPKPAIEIEVDSDAGTVKYTNPGHHAKVTEDWVLADGQWKKRCGVG